MARIRTVKPELFGHEELFDAERETGLPLRLAFIGLFTCCDREGRFKWRPRTLKLDVLPYDDVDFSRVLDALATRGFIRKYAFDTEEYGVIPSWHKHQVINNRESASDIPAPIESSYISMTSTPKRRVNDASTTRGQDGKEEGKGREGKGTEGENPLVDMTADRAVKVDPVEGVFEYWKRIMESPGSKLDKKRRDLIVGALKNYTPREVCEAIKGCSMTPHNMGINDRNTKFNGINVILRSADQIDRFIGTARANPNGKAAGQVQTEAELLAEVRAKLNIQDDDGGSAPDDDPNIIDMEESDA